MSASSRADYLQYAVDLAVENVQSGRGGPFAALVVHDGAVLATGTNRVTTNNDPTAHAEITAIRAACEAQGDFELTGCTLFSSCEPCPMCLGAIYWTRLDRVVYAATSAQAAHAGFDDDHIYEELEKPPAARRIPMEQHDGVAAHRPFEAWA
ncbi:MAG: nucleoside deaminase, partial [Salinibacter sp.]